MSLAKENREAEGADLLLKTPDKSHAMSTFPTTEQTEDDQHHQANPTVTAAEYTSNATMPLPRPEQAEDQIDMKVSWDESSSYHDHKSPCPNPRRESSKTTDERIEPKSETAPNEIPTPPLLEKAGTVEDPVKSSRPTLLSSEAPKEVVAPMATVQGENPYLKTRHLPVTQSQRSDDMAAARGDNPHFLTRPVPRTQSSSTSGEGIQAVQWTAPGASILSSLLPLTSTQAAWKSSQTAWQSIKRGEQRTEIAQTSALALASGEAATSSEVTRQLTKRRKQTTKIAQSSPLAPKSSESAWRPQEIDQKGEQTAEIAQKSTLALASSASAWQSSKIAWELIEGKQRTAEKVRDHKEQIAASSSKAGHRYIGATLISQPGPKVREETADHTLSRYSPLIVVPGPHDDSSQPIPPARTLGDHTITKQPVVSVRPNTVMPPPQRKSAIPASDRKAAVFSENEVQKTCLVERVRPQTLSLICKPPDPATHNISHKEEASRRDPPSSSQPSKPPNPSQGSKIQKIPTKNLAQQYYSQMIRGGWRILNSRDAAIRIQRENRAWEARKRTAEGKCKEAAEKQREEESNRKGSGSQSPSLQPSCTHPPTSDGITSINPPSKRRRQTDYQGLISCRPSDKLWKSWENKHLLRSYAAGLSFAQISASREFSNGLVIRSEKECHEQYKALHEWQPMQDEELLRVGESASREDEKKDRSPEERTL